MGYLTIQWRDPRWLISVVGIGSIASLAFALISQYGFDLAPCILCIYQRWPHAAVVAIALMAFLIGRRLPEPFQWGLVGTGAIALLIGGGIGVFHAGVEQHWWEGTSSCGSDLNPAEMSLEEFRAALAAAPVTRCDEIPWTFLGLSMAVWNAIYSLLVGTSMAVITLRQGSYKKTA